MSIKSSKYLAGNTTKKTKTIALNTHPAPFLSLPWLALLLCLPLKQQQKGEKNMNKCVNEVIR